MASVCRSAATRGARFAFRSVSNSTSLPRRPPTSPLLPSPASATRRLARYAPPLLCSESLMPLHTAIASARLKSNISINSRLWGWLNQGLALPR
ncbi:protein NUCLEAR FUSION DEFECTIVE 6, mitochondrial-like isoform X3 [Nymphaea colorata]|uniref:protein NUCLEAR FUSION DEFECTIVE 6, mitochondrial-like isoform X3 n=1 Tax=Nymphaea colorata TaxID=210225 RepID=UPI00214F039C|nr:protein NUCLEAR FUSION DEFECTIVE 6, mitochondrial-like isoform X3 [Nymphaea colorata]